MPKEIQITSKISIFKGQQIRKTIHKNEWWFVINDVIQILTDTTNPSDYLKKMRKTRSDAFRRVGTNCHPPFGGDQRWQAKTELC